MTTQNKVLVSLNSTVVNGKKHWNAVISCPNKPESFKDIFYSSIYFGRTQYYADYLQYLFGIKTDCKPESWDYDDRALEPPQGFDFTVYDKTAENQQPVTIEFYPLPETNGKQNWTVSIESPQYESSEIISYQTEFYDVARLYYDNLKYLLGISNELPNEDNYNLLLKKDAITGETFV